MAQALVGHTGFVGSNLLRQSHFEFTYNSRTIADIAGRSFDLLVISAVPAAMWAANRDPKRDWANIASLFAKLSLATAERVALISTIAVYAEIASAPDEETILFESNTAYGRHRREFEQLINDHFRNVLTLRLPALFGHDLKKNFLFDLLNPVPSFVKADDFERLKALSDPSERALLQSAFEWAEDLKMWRFDRAGQRGRDMECSLTALCGRAGLAARNFTNSESTFQYYNLAHLWRDIQRGFASRLALINVCSEPLRANEIARRVAGIDFVNSTPPVIRQDVRSRYARHWGHERYLYTADEVLADMIAFSATTLNGEAGTRP